MRLAGRDNGRSTCVHVLCPCTMPIDHACTLAILHACSMAIAHAYTMAIVQACIMAMKLACTMAIVHACTMAIVHALYYGHHECTKAIVHACTMAILQANGRRTCMYHEHGICITSCRAHVPFPLRRLGSEGKAPPRAAGGFGDP